MRRTTNGILVLVCALAWPAIVSAQTPNSMAEGFGGLTFGNTASNSAFGANIAAGLTDNVQIVGEGGYLRDIKPSLLGSVRDLSPVNMRVAAFYGEGGVRFIASPRSVVRPYAEATAGFARLSTNVDGLGARTALVDTALNFFNRTEPLLGAGAGILLQAGPILVDVGYRYKKILGGNSIEALISGGNDFRVSQVRVGVGIRF